MDWIPISPVNMGRLLPGYSEEKENDRRIYPVRSKFRSSQTRLATYRTASKTLQEEEPERLRAKRLQI